MPNRPFTGTTAAPIHGHGETVLFIDENPPARELMEEVFKWFNYHVLVARSVGEALELWARHRWVICAVVSDCDLGRDRMGLSLLHEFARAQPGLVLILGSGSLTVPLVQELEQTTLKCLPKPFEILKLLELLRSGLDARPQATTTQSETQTLGSATGLHEVGRAWPWQ